VRTQSEILILTDVSASPAYRGYLNRRLGGEGSSSSSSASSLSRLLSLRLLRVVLLAVSCTSIGTSTSSGSQFCDCNSTSRTTRTCTVGNVKPCLISYHIYKTLNVRVRWIHNCHIVVHRVPLNLINWLRVCQIRIELLAPISIDIVLSCGILWPTLRPLRLHTQYSLTYIFALRKLLIALLRHDRRYRGLALERGRLQKVWRQT
jgi:hypothetical protein